jgi:hypothetical protein
MTVSRLAGAIELPDGAWVRGRGLCHPLPGGPLPAFGLYLGTDRLRRHHGQNLTWPHSWVDWPDFLLPATGGRPSTRSSRCTNALSPGHRWRSPAEAE